MSLAQDTTLAELAGDWRKFRRLPELADATTTFRVALRIIARNWTIGSVTFVLPSGRELHVTSGQPGPAARLIVHDFRFMRRALATGDIGFAEGYMAGEWDTPDLSALLCVFAANWSRLHQVTQGNPLAWTFNRIRHALRGNSREGARKNIHAHYDLGNAFYEQWLDPTMTYSSARYEGVGQPLADAQTAKYRTLAKSMGLQAGQSVLEIGCGWGGFAEFAAREIGAKVTAITISEEQFRFAKARISREGLNEQADIRLVDYRDVEGSFDRVASIEMFEAVGERYWPAYFGKIHQALAPGGRAGLQIITIRDEDFNDYRGRADFIQKYIFPGGMLPSEERLRAVTRKAGLAWDALTRFGQDYADTLAEWHRNFDASWTSIRPLGFDERFRRLWKFYLSYCEAGFRTERTNVVQLSLTKA
jgi:cyclopropane-fatty-acyl-phospholipid synthase